LEAAGVSPGADPTNAAFGLMAVSRVNGVLAYMLLDKMEYADATW